MGLKGLACKRKVQVEGLGIMHVGVQRSKGGLYPTIIRAILNPFRGTSPEARAHPNMK